MNIATVLYLLLAVGVSTASSNTVPANLRGAGDRKLRQSSYTRCDIAVSLSCKLYQEGQLGGPGEDCSTFIFPTLVVDPETVIDGYRNKTCSGIPETATFVYNGGDCSQTENTDSLEIECEDYNTSPPREKGQKSYIVVTGVDDKRAVYHGAFVGVGDIFMVHDGGNKLDEGFTIRIYDNVSQHRKLLQKISYSPSLCSDTAELSNSFGAVELLGYTNRFDGYAKPGPGIDTKTTNKVSKTISVKDEYVMKLDVTFSLAEGTTVEGVSIDQAYVILEDDNSATSRTSDLTDAIKDQVISPNNSVIATVSPADADFLLQEPGDYTVHVATIGTRNSGTVTCLASDSLQLPVGIL